MKNQYIQKQQGMATLIVSVTVLIITTLMVFFAAKVGLFDQRMAANDARYKEAFATAEAGLDFAIEKFEDQFARNFTGLASWTTIISNSQVGTATETDGTSPPRSGKGSFTVNITPTGVCLPVPISPNTCATSPASIPIYSFISTGVGADGTGTATISREVTMKKILGGSSPPSPLVIGGSVGTGGNFNVVANPNGGGNGIPVSIWTGGPSPAGDVSMSGSAATCHIQSYTGNNPTCSKEKLSSDGNIGPDIVQNDSNFPSDLFRFTFGVARADWQTIYNMADLKHQAVADCSSLGTTSGQKFSLWWVTGDCNMGSSQVIGSQDDPVILVIDDHQLGMSGGGARINGVTFVFNNPNNAAMPSADFSGSSAIYGALVSDVGVNSNGSFSIVYDQSILPNLTSDNRPSNFSTAYIPGSWRDF